MCVVAEGGGRIYSFGENKRVETTPSQYVCANKGGKSTAMYCTVYTIKYCRERGVSVEKILFLPSFNPGLLNVRVNRVKNHILICVDVRVVINEPLMHQMAPFRNRGGGGIASNQTSHFLQESRPPSYAVSTVDAVFRHFR
jgi:hypothetical protein